MRPAPPAHYRSTVVERLGFQRLLDQPTRMILRNLERRPLRAFLTVVGIATACGILVTGLFFDDVIDHIVLVEYGVAQREDVTVSFVERTSMGALPELRALAGVQYVEPFRSVPVRLRHGHRSYQAGMEGIPAGSYLRRVVDRAARPVRIPAHGVLLSQRLAEILDAQPGDSVRVEILEGHRRTRSVPVSGLAEQYIGLGAYMEMDALNRLMGEGPALSGAYLLTDERYEEALRTELRDRPRVASIVSQDQSVQAYLDTAAQSMLVFMFVLTLFAGVIAFGVVYNNMRIALSERDRELASLRVLGFRRGEIAYILLGEMALLVLVSIPLGFGLGAALAAWSVAAFQTDMYSFPVVFSRGTFGTAAAIILAAATLSGLMVRRRLNQLDLIGVLKTRE